MFKTSISFVCCLGYHRSQVCHLVLLLYACSICLTLSKAVVDFGPRDFVPGLAYVALSHLKSLEGIALLSDFADQRLQNTQVHKKRRDDKDRLQIIAANTLQTYAHLLDSFETN